MGRHVSLAIRLFLVACIAGSPLGAGLLTGVVAGGASTPAVADGSTFRTDPGSGAAVAGPGRATIPRTAAPGSTPGVAIAVKRTASTTLSVTVTYEVPPSVRGLRVVVGDLPVEGTRGFDRCGSNRLCWDGSTAEPTLALRYDLRTRTRSYAGIVNDSMVFAPAPRIYTVWRTDDERRTAPLFAKGEYATYEVASERTVVANATLFHGPHAEYERTTGSTDFRLIVPDGTRLGPSRERLFDTLADAATALDVGGRNREVIAVALADTPGETKLGLAGATVGNAFWARAGASLSNTHSVWLHEYVHTRQRFADRSRAMEWFVEASAEYYAARLSHDLGLVNDLEYEWELKSRRVSASDDVLADPTTWERPNVPYRKGALVLAALDAEIRNRTEGDHSLEDVFRRLNRADGTLTYESFVTSVVAVSADPAMERWLDRYVKSDATPRYDPYDSQERLPTAPRMDEVAALVPTSPLGFGVTTIGLALATMFTLSVLSTIGRTLQWLVEAIFDGLGWLADRLSGRRR
jgi:hypothetical protein